MATIVAAGAGGNWTSGATWVGGTVPTAADDVQLDGTSGNVTINAAAVCRSLDCTGYTGVLTHAAATTLSVGDGTAGAGNAALKFVAGMTYTLGNASTSALSFVSTAAAQQTITWGGKTTGAVTFNGSGGQWQIQDTWTTPNAAVNLTTGTLDTNSQTCSWLAFISNLSTVRTLTLGSSSITCSGAVNSLTWDMNNPAGLTITPNTATLTLSATNTILQTGVIHYNGLSLILNGAGNAVIGAGSATFANVTRTGTATRTAALQLNGNANTLTVTGTLTVQGNSTINRVIVRTGSIGLAATINAGTVIASNADFQDIIAGGAANWNLAAISGGAGDGGGNTGITFTPPATQTWQGTTGGDWSDVTKWTSRVPLPQDNVIINAAFTAGQTVTADMLRLGADITWNGVGGNPTWANLGSLGSFIYGSLTLTPGMSLSFVGGHTFAGRGTHTITSAGKTFTALLVFGGKGGSYTLQDSLTCNNQVTINAGALNTNSQTVTASALFCLAAAAQPATAYLNLANSTVNLTGASGDVLVVSNNGVLSAGAAVANIATQSTQQRNIAILFDVPTLTINYTIAGSTGPLLISNYGGVIGTLNFSDASNARTLKLLAGTSAIFREKFNIRGTPGQLMSIVSSTPGTTATVRKNYGFVDCDYVSIQDITATGGASWYAGSHSVNVSNNSGWFFQDYSPARFLELM